MESLKNPTVIWFILGLVFFLLEFVLPGLIVFFFAIGAWIVAILSLFLDISVNVQLGIFIVSTIITLLLFRKLLKRLMWSIKNNNEIADEFIGKTAVAETEFGPGHDGKVVFKGTIWDARTADSISKGEQVTIIGNESILLIVKSSKNPL